jgi:hypothetical protein
VLLLVVVLVGGVAARRAARRVASAAASTARPDASQVDTTRKVLLAAAPWRGNGWVGAGETWWVGKTV